MKSILVALLLTFGIDQVAMATENDWYQGQMQFSDGQTVTVHENRIRLVAGKTPDFLVVVSKNNREERLARLPVVSLEMRDMDQGITNLDLRFINDVGAQNATYPNAYYAHTATKFPMTGTWKVNVTLQLDDGSLETKSAEFEVTSTFDKELR